MNKWLKRGVWVLGALLFCFLLLYIFRFSILRGVGQYLIVEDPAVEAEIAFVLGGNSYDRGRSAAKLHRTGRIEGVVCLGENVPSVLEAFGIDSSEADLSARFAKEKGIPPEDVKVYEKGTSTMEEAFAAFRYCQEYGVDSAIILSDKFHLRRVRYVFDPVFEKIDTELIYQGVSSSSYDESRWWGSEQGMIMVNNEYMKLLYYSFFKEDPEGIRKELTEGD